MYIILQHCVKTYIDKKRSTEKVCFYKVIYHLGTYSQGRNLLPNIGRCDQFTLCIMCVRIRHEVSKLK